MLARIRREHVLLWCAGYSLIILHYLLVQHVGVALRHTEAAVLVVAFSYFSGISLGYYIADSVRDETLKLLVLPYIILQLLSLLFLQTEAQLLRSLLGPATSLATANIFVSVMLAIVLTPITGALLSIVLPRLVHTTSARLSRLYGVEVVGSICAVVSLPLLVDSGHIFVITAYLASIIAVFTLLVRSVFITLTTVILSVFFVRFYNQLDRTYAAKFYQDFYPNRGIGEIVHSIVTPYHKIEVLSLPHGEHMLTLNGKKQFGPSSHYSYSYFLAEFPAKLLGQPVVALLGAGSMSSVGRIGEFVKSITIAELDLGVFETSRKYFPKYNRIDEFMADGKVTLVHDDAKHFLGSSTQFFDLILDDIPPAKSRQLALTYTREFFTLVKNRLTPSGIFSLPCLRPTPKRDEYGRRMLATVTSVFDNYFVVASGGSFYIYAGGPGLPNYSKQQLLDSIKRTNRDGVEILNKHDIDELVSGAEIITINNMAGLVYE